MNDRPLHRISVAALVLALTATVWAQQSTTRYWYDHGNGITVIVPDGARVVDSGFKSDDTLVRFIGDEGEGDYAINVAVRQNPKQVDLDDVLNTAIQEVAATAVDAKVLEKNTEQVNGRKIVWIYYRNADRHHSPLERRTGPAKPWILGQAFFERSPDTLVMVTLDVDEPLYKRGRDAFESIYRTMVIEDPVKLAKHRAELIDAGVKWRSGIKFDNLVKILTPEQLYRITRGGMDVGYMSISQRPDEAMQVKGIRIDIQARVHNEKSTVDTLSNFFLSEDMATEIWSVRITNRPILTTNDPRNADALAQSYIETGLRSHGVVSVTVQDSTNKHTLEWNEPVKGYLSQVETHLLGQLMGDAPQEMGFYAYFSAGNALSFRTERVEKQTDGSYRVITRPNPEQPQYLTTYSAKGAFVRQELPDGSVMVPTTRAELAVRWHVPLNPPPAK